MLTPPRSSRTLSEVINGGRIKGGMIRAHLDWIRKKQGEEGVQRILKTLDRTAAQEISNALATTWVSFASLIALDKAISAEFGSDAVRDLGHFSARQNLATTYRIYKRDDIHDFFRHSAALHSQFQDFGSAKYEQAGPHSGRMIHSGYPSYSPLYCASAIGYYQEAIAIHGGKSPSVTESSCHCAGDKACIFELSWS